MRKDIISVIVIILTAVGMLSLSSCKRGAPSEPIVIATSGLRIIISGTANPSTLYIPESQPTVSSVINVRVLNNDGSPAGGYTIIFEIEDLLGRNDFFGYFEGNMVSDTRVTDGNGMTQITYYVPASANVKATVSGRIRATLVDDGRLDNLTEADIYDLIPVRLIPYREEGVLIHGRVLTPSGSGVENISVTLDGADDNLDSITVTRSSGSYEFFVPAGWYGTITPSAPGDGYTFEPDSYTFESTNPIVIDTDNLDFVAIFESGNTLSADVTAFEAPASGDSTTVNVVNGTGDAPIPYSVVTSVEWITVSDTSGVTPGSFLLTVSSNPTSSDRSGSVTIAATGTEDSSVSISVSQKSFGASEDSVLAVDPSSLTFGFATGTKTVTVYNSGSEDTINFSASSPDSWVTVIDPIQGSTTTTVEITVAALNGTSSRTGTVTFTPTTTGVNNTVTLTITQSPDPLLVADQTSVVVPVTAGDVTRIYISSSDGGSHAFSLTQGITWLSVTTTSGTTGTTSDFIEFSTTANGTGSDRTETLVITSTTAAPVTITITQSGS
ncbi:MAG: hypothetical protein GY940_23610 [bacterium]|nr:hypothetical protein [bacterium]